jgi:hypothetical protein
MDMPFLTSVVDGDECSASRPGRFTLGTHWIGGWVSPRADLDIVEKQKILPLPGIEPRPFSLQPVAMPTELSRLLQVALEKLK